MVRLGWDCRRQLVTPETNSGFPLGGSSANYVPAGDRCRPRRSSQCSPGNGEKRRAWGVVEKGQQQRLLGEIYVVHWLWCRTTLVVELFVRGLSLSLMLRPWRLFRILLLALANEELNVHSTWRLTTFWHSHRVYLRYSCLFPTAIRKSKLGICCIGGFLGGRSWWNLTTVNSL